MRRLTGTAEVKISKKSKQWIGLVKLNSGRTYRAGASFNKKQVIDCLNNRIEYLNNKLKNQLKNPIKPIESPSATGVIAKRYIPPMDWDNECKHIKF